MYFASLPVISPAGIRVLLQRLIVRRTTVKGDAPTVEQAVAA
jgi:hypothetical protein